MSGQSGGHRLRLSKLNDQLTCRLCGGYFIDATTIIECLHSFCRSCIVKYLENNKYCPICEVQVHKSKPLLNIRPDHTLQDIVYKLVPGCYQNEMRCRREFYSKNSEPCTQVTSPEARGEPTESHIYSPDESLSLSLEYFSPCKDIKEVSMKPLLRRYLRCPAAVTVFHLQKLIRAKYGLTDAHRVDVMYKEEPLCSSYTLMDVMYIYHWRRKVPLHLSYRIFESSPKRIKLSEDNINYKTSLVHAGIDSIELKEEKPVTKEWKEVQLKISETGIMSITDISDQQFKKNLRTEESASVETIIKTSVIPGSGSNVSEMTEKSKQPSEKQTIDDCNTSKLSEIDDKKNSNQSEVEKISTERMDIKSKQEEEFQNGLDNNNVEVKISSQTSVQSHEIKQTMNQDEMKGNNNENMDQEESSKNNNNTIIPENKLEILKHNSKNEGKSINTGSKINALSVKLQFQPKLGQDSSSSFSMKKVTKDKKNVPQSSKKVDIKAAENSTSVETKNSVDTSKTQVLSNNSGVAINKSASSSGSKSISETVTPEARETTQTNTPAHAIISVSSELRETESSMKSVQSVDRCSLQEQSTSEKKMSSPSKTSTESTQKTSEQTNTISQKSPQVELLTKENHTSLNLSTSSSATIGNGINTTSTSSVSHSTSIFPYTVQDLVNNAMLKNSFKSLATSTAQKLSVSTVSESTIPTCSIPDNPTAFTMPPMSISSALKNNYSNPGISASRESTLKGNLEMTGVYSVPPCPDAIPISLMKSTMRKNELITKGSNLNEICAKIGASGSKINDICAKIGENSKEKNKTELRSKSDIPDLLKIGRKSSSSSTTIDSSNKQQHTGIPNVSTHAPIGNAVTTENKNLYSNMKDNLRATSLASTSSMVTSHSMQKVPSSISKKQSQAVGYKTLRDPPRCWNPTLSKNNYVAVKNQNKETQINQTALSERSKSIQSKPAKIFKMRNMPRYLGNPASGVKPIYSIGNESKEKEQSTMTTATTTNTATSSKNGNLSMMKIDPKTLSPIVSSVNSPIISPPPYSPSVRNYQNPPFSRDICRSTGSPMSPKNSSVNMLSTSPFIPSPTPNMNPRLIYPHFPPPFPDATKFPNPLIRSPIGIPSPSAFHSSLPPSINKLYQRSSYIPQTTGFSPVSQPPTVQRIPPSTYSSPKSPKTTSLTAISPASYGLAKSEMQIVATTSLETSNLLLPENVQKEDVSAFNLSKTGSFCNAESVKTSTEVVRNSKPSALSPASNIGLGKNTSTGTSKSKSESSSSDSGNQSKEQNREQLDTESVRCKEENSYTAKGQSLEKKRSDENSDSMNKRKEKSVSQINGNLTEYCENSTSESKKETSAEEQRKEQCETKVVQQIPENSDEKKQEPKNGEREKAEEQRETSEVKVSKAEI